jgi:hypothetical protein
MIAPLAKLMDWSALQLKSMHRPPFIGQALGLEKAIELVDGPDFIPAESHPAQIEFDGPLQFRFPSPRPGAVPENNIVYGRLYRCLENWRERPVIILLHGWNSTLSHRFRFPWIAKRCIGAGFNAATLELPFHFQRRSRRRGGLHVPYFLQLAEMRAQAVAEVRALMGWLLEQGCPAVALWGASYGGWAGRTDRLSGCTSYRGRYGGAGRTNAKRLHRSNPAAQHSTGLAGATRGARKTGFNGVEPPFATSPNSTAKHFAHRSRT